MRWLILRDRYHRMRSMPIQSPEGERLLSGMPEDQRLASWHVVTPAAEVLSGGAAAPAVARLLPRGQRIAGLLERFPRATDAAYRRVARHRAMLGRLTRTSCADCG